MRIEERVRRGHPVVWRGRGMELAIITAVGVDRCPLPLISIPD